jgi:hypothetical protein
VWTRGRGTPPVVKVLVWFTVESKAGDGTGGGVYGQSVGRRLSIPVGKHATVFQAELYTILTCAYELETKGRPEKYVSICSDSQAALKALQAAKKVSIRTTLPKGVEWYLYPAHCGNVLGLWTCWGTRK